MNNFKEFLSKAAADETAKEEILGILNGKKMADATDEQLAEICEVAKKFGVDITAEELRTFANGKMELDDDELDAVAGGFSMDDILRQLMIPSIEPSAGGKKKESPGTTVSDSQYGSYIQ